MNHDFDGSMDISSGIFTAPKTSLYHFIFNSGWISGKFGCVRFYVNDEMKQDFYHKGSSSYFRSIDTAWSYLLNEGDKVYMYNGAGSSIHVGGDYGKVRFIGSFSP